LSDNRPVYPETYASMRPDKNALDLYYVAEMNFVSVHRGGNRVFKIMYSGVDETP